ncbi:hypothetical protein VTO73DRAFT_10335 [Trametes versicolor]
MGTHISKVKSLTLDSWTKEQVEFMKSKGNVKSNAHYNPDEVKHPPPTNMIDSERDSDLEKYIRSKYEYKSFVSKSSQVAALLGPSRSSASRLSPAPTPPRSQTVPAPTPPRSQTVPAPTPSTTTANRSIATPSLPASAPAPAPAAVSNLAKTQSQFRSVSQPVAPSFPSSSQPYAPVQSIQTQFAQPSQQSQTSSNPVWNDLAQLQAPAMNSSLPLQYASPTGTQPMGIPNTSTGLSAPNPYGGLSVSPNAPFPSSFGQQPSPGGMFPGSQARSMSLNTGMSMNMGAGGMGYGAGMPGGASPSMLHPQPTQFNGYAGSSPMSMHNSTPSPGPGAFAPQGQQPGMNMGMGMGMQGSFAPSSFGGQQPGQQFLQPQQQQAMQPQGSSMFSSQPLQYGQSSPMLQPQALGGQQQQMLGGQPQMQGMASGNPYMQQPQQQQQQQQQQMFGSQQPSFMGAPGGQFGQPSGMQQQQQQPMYGQGGWQQPQQQWGGM